MMYFEVCHHMIGAVELLEADFAFVILGVCVDGHMSSLVLCPRESIATNLKTHLN